MHRVLSILGLILVSSCPSVYALAESRSDLDALIAEYWAFYIAENPLAATRLGLPGHDDRMPSVSRRAADRRFAIEQDFLSRVRAINLAELDDESRINAQLLAWVLEDSTRAHALGLQRIPFNTFSGFFMAALTASSGVTMSSVADYRDYLARLADIPRYFNENLANMREGSKDGFVLPRVVIDGIVPTLDAQLKDDPETSGFYEPLREIDDRVPAAERERLRIFARQIIREDVLPAFAAVAEFLRDEYHASESLGAEQLPAGKVYYAFQIRRYTTQTQLDADAIHATGLAEVERIRGEMQAIVHELRFDGDLAEFIGFLLSDPQFYARSERDLLREVAYVAKRIDYVLPGYFGRLPRQSYGIVPVPTEIAPNYVTGAYYAAPLGGSHGGAFWVNTYRLDQRPLYEIPALTLHEAVPGHHLQNALTLEMDDVPQFRRSLGFSAFGEGWALYAEKLGVEMGIYETPYEHFGRLSYEMWRACRLVIDTGIHAKGWTREQAMDYLLANTALSMANARAEIDRYISWPGQALAYKLGELKIWELRRRAERELGEDFDLRDFHDAILGNGELPLALLEAAVGRFIAATAP